MDARFTDDRLGGGTVEPTRPAAATQQRAKPREEPAAERFELRDPFNEVTYRTKTIDEMAAQAERLGATRFHAIHPDGTRTPVIQAHGSWQRQGGPDPQPPRKEEPHPDVPKPAPLTIDTGSTPPRTPTTGLDAERAGHIERLEAALHDRYVIKRGLVSLGEVSIDRTVYRHRGDPGRIAFTESMSRLATDTNSPSVARSMVDVAQLRKWDSIRVSGHEDFKRLVWLEASVRGVKTLGYEPSPGDLELLKKEREARLINRIEPAHGNSAGTAASPTEKTSARGGGGRKAVLAAIEAVLVAKRVPEPQRVAVMAAATEKLAERVRDGHAPKVKVYDKAAPSQRRDVPTPEPQRGRDRPTPGPVR